MTFDHDRFRRAVDAVRAMPTPDSSEIHGVDYPAATREELHAAIFSAEYWRADFAAHPATLHAIREFAADHLPARYGSLDRVPLGPNIYADPDVPPGTLRLRRRNQP